MGNIQWWEWLLLAGGAYIAVMTLVKLIRRRQQELLAELTRQAADKSKRKKSREKRAA